MHARNPETEKHPGHTQYSGACRSGMATPTDGRCLNPGSSPGVGMSPPQPLFRAVAGLDPHPYPLRAATSRPSSPSGRPRRSATQVRGKTPPNPVEPSQAIEARAGRAPGNRRVRSGSTPERPIAGKAADDAMTLHRRSKRLSPHGRVGGSVTAARRPLCRDRKPARPIALVRSAWSVGLCNLGQTPLVPLLGAQIRLLPIPLSTVRYAAEGPERGAR